MRWPWNRPPSGARVAVATSPAHFAYAVAGDGGALALCGLLRRGDDTAEEFARRIRAIGLPPRGACAVLPLPDTTLVQIEAPPVKPEELKAAARWRIKDQVEGRLEDLTIDVMVVGEDRQRPNRQLFVAATPNTIVQDTVARLRGAGLEPGAVDITETAQRNLQSALAEAAGHGSRATAALVRHGDHALLTICAGGELYHARRLDWTDTLWRAAPPVSLPLPLSAGDSPDFVDYGAEPETGSDSFDATSGDAPRLVIELQRSFDLWDRSWPALPIAALWVHAGEHSGEMASVLSAALGQAVQALDPATAFPGFDEATATPEVRAAVLPIVGALRRDTHA